MYNPNNELKQYANYLIHTNCSKLIHKYEKNIELNLEENNVIKICVSNDVQR